MTHGDVVLFIQAKKTARQTVNIKHDVRAAEGAKGMPVPKRKNKYVLSSSSFSGAPCRLCMKGISLFHLLLFPLKLLFFQ